VPFSSCRRKQLGGQMMRNRKGSVEGSVRRCCTFSEEDQPIFD